MKVSTDPEAIPEAHVPSPDPIAVVRAFTAAWERRDVDAICSLVADDCVWENPQSPPIVGPDAMRRAITPNVTGATGIEMDLLTVALAADSRTVLCERLDAMIFSAGRVPIPVMGTFVVRDNLIVAWRDYFDQGLYRGRMAGIGHKPGIEAQRTP